MIFRCWALFWLLGFTSVSFADERPVDYSRDIRPILAKNCLACHGPDAQAREGGLRLDTRAGALSELESGARAIVLETPEKSELLARITTADEFSHMPPPETGKKLTPEEIELLRRWIELGAPYSDHWSFKPLQETSLPSIEDNDWPRRGIDYFVLHQLERKGLAPSPEADQLVLLRRVFLDLIGLPPSQQDVESYLQDTSPGAYERVVDRLLASPHFGERWGRYWLDLARYADSNGYLGDELRPNAYRYRDWVIDAINSDMPFDQFTIEQVAGDLLPDATTDQKIATGFHRNSMKNTEAGADREADRVLRTVDRLSTIGTAWLGLTVACAECHTHKFDPISHREFYEMYAFFNNLDDYDLKLGESPAPPEDPKQKQEREKKLDEIAAKIKSNIKASDPAELASLERSLTTLAQLKAMRSEADLEALEHWRAELDSKGKSLAKAYEKLAAKRPGPTAILACTVRNTRKPRTTHVHHRGDFRQPKEEVHPGTPEFLPPLQPRESQPDRLDLARWLVREDQPLTPRTTVNHFWAHLFGRGIVETEDNFGTAGSEPSHPELLDWLAKKFIDSGWSRKAIIRLIVTSSTYRQSSHVSEELFALDPQNILLARQARLRLEGEVIRDMALAASGLLNPRIHGPGIRPPLNSRITEVSRNRNWKVSRGGEKYRRGLYIVFRRATPYPMLTIFDVPDSTTACADRERSNSPLQALTLLNDPVFFECTQYLGDRLNHIDSTSPDDWIASAVSITLSRPPLAEELHRVKELYREQRKLLAEVSDQDLCQITGKSADEKGQRELAARILVARSLMNLDEFITRE